MILSLRTIIETHALTSSSLTFPEGQMCPGCMKERGRDRVRMTNQGDKKISRRALAPAADRIFEEWWTWRELNPRPLECHSSALPTAPHAHSMAKLQ